MLQQVGERGVNRLLANQVVVIEDQDELFRLCRETVDERLQDGTQRRSMLCLQIGDKLCTESRQRSVQGGKHISPEQHRLIVSFIQRQPGDPCAFWWQRLDPVREQRGFAEAIRSRDQRQRALESLHKQLKQARSQDQRM